MPPGFREILGHLPEGFQEHGIFEFAEIEIAAPGVGPAFAWLNTMA
jgi:hypothetical protein